MLLAIPEKWYPTSIFAVGPAASGGAHVGAYRMASNGQPGTLFADFTNGSPFDCSTTGTKQNIGHAGVVPGRPILDVYTG